MKKWNHFTQYEQKKDFVGPAVIEASDCTKSFAIGSVIIEQRVIA